jgi:hypothetical protein
MAVCAAALLLASQASGQLGASDPLKLRSHIESWAKQQHDKPTRSEAIRRLIELALAFKAKKQAADK